MRYFVFNGKDSRTLFPLTNHIYRPYLPPVTVQSFNIPNRAGAVSVRRNDIGTREITVGVTFFDDTWEDLRERVRKLSEFLLYTEDKPLTFSDEPHLQYYARFNQSATDLTEIAKMGQGELHFTCFDPFAYELTETTFLFPMMTQEQIVTNNGTTETFPKFRVVPTANANFIQITNVSTGEFIYYNAPVLAGSVLIIDHAKNQIYDESTRENLIRYMTLDSNFFPLRTGDNTILIQNQSPSGAGVNEQTLQVTYRERYF